MYVKFELLENGYFLKVFFAYDSPYTTYCGLVTHNVMHRWGVQFLVFCILVHIIRLFSRKLCLYLLGQSSFWSWMLILTSINGSKHSIKNKQPDLACLLLQLMHVSSSRPGQQAASHSGLFYYDEHLPSLYCVPILKAISVVECKGTDLWN